VHHRRPPIPLVTADAAPAISSKLNAIQYDRRAASRPIANKLLIVCEGQKTEPQYFKGIRQHKRLRTLQVTIVDASGRTNPIAIINRAITERQTIQADKGWEANDSVWAVFDGDEHRHQDPQNWNSAIDKAKTQKINLAITNPCFEFWYLIHYQDATANMDAKTALKQLQKHRPNYTKAQTLYPDPLEELTDAAIQRAEKIAKQIANTGLDPYSNPCCSRLPELVKILLELP
jgi:RloB-like protein